ncbi:Acyl-coenzyme A thioesterase [Alteripontixanthobacter maritimus]|uniref:Acyl-CoA thioesterase 2 n=1 Tax=Alteripontixanthobacter maritimus TaxID=2161824 RepID=A0A369QC26_9SPHN|nr:acyl-CoA thioesterase II [Alteripontixanthobacter maritimus]RDC60469.1 Acyl-coenzyme A thioesterase [Alteripontixanthobacter maritimus]
MNTVPTDENPSNEQLVAGLTALLTVTRDAENSFTGKPQPGGMGRVFGGQVIAQALQAAQATVGEDRAAHSLHAYFLRGGEEGPAIHYQTARDLDGRSFANRRVVATQGDAPILNLTASFQRPEDGMTHQAAAMSDAVPPEDLQPDMEQRAKLVDQFGGKMSEAQRRLVLRPRPIEMRTMDKLHWMNSEPKAPVAHSWFRTVAPLPDISANPANAALHRAVIAYASDYTLLGTAALPHGLSWMRGELVGASLDHAIWFHRPARADEWLLYVTESPWSGSGRGFNRGSIFDREGHLVASVAQEGMMRKRKAKTD